MFKKRAQVTIFVIIAIVIVVGIVGFFLLQNKNSILNQAIPTNIQPVYNYLDSCFKNSFEESLFLVGLQGGYTSKLQNGLTTNLSKVAFAFYGNQINFLSEKELQKEIEDYLSLKVKNCLDNNSFDASYEISYSSIKPSVKTEDLKTTATLSAPLTIRKGETAYSLDRDYKIEQKIRLGQLYTITDAITQQLLNDSSSIDLTYLTSLDYQVNIIDYGNQQFLYTFTDLNNSLGGQPYLYQFAIKI
jgi:hypothetical protein